ncbi:MAG: ornithine cyclodeaminase family protein [Firmicutes bacterium]|nr:ornithine cyclodeaminase family protein [Bacillota bacterium]
MKILTKEDIKKVFTMKEAIEANKEAFGIYSSKKSITPLRTKIDVKKYNATNLFMPAYAEDLDTSGMKIISVFPGNVKINKPVVPSQMILMDGSTGEVIALLNGTYLTQLRTGAITGAATDLLSNKDSKIGALFGTGGQARCQLEAMLTVRDLDEVRIFDIDKDKCINFVDKVNKDLSDFNTTFKAVNSSDEAIDNADIITTITTSTKPVFDGKKVKKGAHINGVGSFTPSMRELDEYIIKRADKVIADTLDGVLAEAGDFLIPIKENSFTKDIFTGELGDIVNKKVKKRENKEEITICKSVGSAILDLVVGKKIYDNSNKKDIGQIIKL